MQSMTISQIILASASPRRRDLLSQLGLNFTVAGQDLDETQIPDEEPLDYVRRMALRKAQAVKDEVPLKVSSLVIGSDTIVVCEGAVLGKPVNKKDGLRMLRLLSGKAHSVLTAVSIVTLNRECVSVSKNKVEFRPITKQEAEAYWQSQEPADKAGSYGIQGLGAVFVKTLHGSYSGVMGLPLYETAKLLGEFGIDCMTRAGVEIE